MRHTRAASRAGEQRHTQDQPIAGMSIELQRAGAVWTHTSEDTVDTGSQEQWRIYMRFGCAITPEQISDAIAAGYDYIELAARDLHPEGNHELALQTVSQTLARAHYPLKIEVFWGLLPRDIPIVGPDLDEERLQRYLHRVFNAMWALGGMLVVLANGSARRIPDGFPRDQAERQFAGVLDLIRSECARNSLDLVLEPVNRAETNMLNTLEESCSFLTDHHVEDVMLLADLYHLTAEHEPLEVLQSCHTLIGHVHVADTNRLPPGQGTADFLAFFRALRRIGYNSRITLRCEWSDFTQEAAAALALIKQTWEQ